MRYLLVTVRFGTLVVIALSVGTAVGLAARPVGGGGGTCDLTQLQLRDSTVNQGLGSYDRLVRGKETLVRLYLEPAVVRPRRHRIQITGGTLSGHRRGHDARSGIHRHAHARLDVSRPSRPTRPRR